MSSKRFKLIQFPTCKVCFKNYNQTQNKPYSLVPCCHTFCSACIDRLTDKKCPTCRLIIKEKCINWELCSIIPDETNDNDPTTTEYFKFENDPKSILISEANESIDQFDELIKVSTKNNLQHLNQIRTRINNKTEELINKLIYNQRLILNRIESNENSFNQQLQKLSNEEKVAANKIRKLTDNTGDTNLEVINEQSKILKQCIKSLRQINNENESELSIIELEDHFSDFKIKENIETLKLKQIGIHNYVLKPQANKDCDLAIDENFFIKSVEFDSQAYRIGLRENYKIAEINGICSKKIACYEFLRLVKSATSNLTLSVIKFKRLKLHIPSNLNSFGISIAQFKENSYKKVVKIENDSPADLKGLKENDIIFEINNLNIKNLDMNQIRAILTTSLRKKEVEFLILNHEDFMHLISDDLYFV